MERRFMPLFFLLGSFFAWAPQVMSPGRERFRSQIRLLELVSEVLAWNGRRGVPG